MKLKGVILVAVFSLIAAVTLSQFSVVSAATSSAVTSPVTYFTYLLRGRITYRLFNSLLQIPASGVTVIAKNGNSGATFSTKTNLNGNYALAVSQASASAHYGVKPNDGKNTQWSPAYYMLTVSSDISNLNFVGIGATSSTTTNVKFSR